MLRIGKPMQHRGTEEVDAHRSYSSICNPGESTNDSRMIKYVVDGLHLERQDRVGMETTQLAANRSALFTLVVESKAGVRLTHSRLQALIRRVLAGTLQRHFNSAGTIRARVVKVDRNKTSLT
jgi:hypothetical protein